ncbi:UDP-3-O-(3-hydroxymyristoyl)glucosamine N-acyltransferase [Sedimenticola sp.]|uniref:UDP-3-O-(3-hydroxymyristoyl)glucosamine N-acyltransferase n=1 Tax=Sedimenticola sp. TaxID=1940285 RepID=UPI003D1465EF
MKATTYRLADLATRIGVELLGDGDTRVTHADTIQDAKKGAICFLANSKYRHYLPDTGASAVILGREDAAHSPIPGLISDNPYLTYARVASLLYPVAQVVGGVHISAVVSESAVVDPGAWIGPCCVIGANVEIHADVSIGPGCVIDDNSVIGEQTRLVAKVTVCSGSVIGKRVLIHPGAVIGSDGFGNANDQGTWVKVPQIGAVIIGDDVEIGANTTIDRGALRDTVIADGVRLDNQIQIAHNVRIGEHTAIAGCAGVAGSTTIGKYCTLGGGVGLSGHLEIGDNVHFSGQTLVTRSFKDPGYYSGNLPAVTNGEWRKTIARIRRLENVIQRLNTLEKEVFREKIDKKTDGPV